MTRQLESARTQLANERKESNDKRRRAEEAERELLNVKEQLHKADMEMDRMKQKSTQLKVRTKRLSSYISVCAAESPDSLVSLGFSFSSVSQSRLILSRKKTLRL